MYKIPANTLFTGQKLIYVPECHSTNSLLIELNGQATLPEGTVLITDHQNAGRGQRGNGWEAMPGLNLTLSILLKPIFLAAKDQFQLNMAISLAVADVVQSHVQGQAALKWPNDIIVAGRKVSGILIESQLQGGMITSSIIGIGLNVNQFHFNHPKASSLLSLSGRRLDLNALLQQLMEAVEGRYLELRTGQVNALKDQYMSRLYKFNEPQRFESDGETFLGAIHSVHDDGRLCVESPLGLRLFSLKEVKFLD